MILYLIVAFLATLLGSAAGMGGGVIIKPMMDLLGDYSISEISVFASITVLCMAAFSTVQQITRGFKVTRVLIAVTVGSVAGGVLGSFVLSRMIVSVDGNAVKAVQSAVLFLLLLVCLFHHRIPHKHIKSPIIIGLIGMILGLFSAFLGIGGGPINVAVLGIFLSLEIRRSARASVFIILFSQTAGLIAKTADGVLAAIPDYSVLLVMVPAAIAGALIGTQLNHKLSDKRINGMYRVSVMLVMLICVYNFIVATTGQMLI